MPAFPIYQDLDHDITRIDTAMVREELAACYLLRGGDEFAVIETGTHHTVPIVLDLLAQRGIDRGRVKYVIPTHVHLDHAGGVGGLMQALPEVTAGKIAGAGCDVEQPGWARDDKRLGPWEGCACT
ncbi:MBL fold metallo-hydrolase [Alloalcanivorax gelatiniphagus]|uniref:MBL fold metallo-hydrolase n=1 Tax=Alloalcanivorax gelatiniphagus TaxID=1194167 RepID=UPI001F10995B|nr:MBL fold metallo-hydrolase [Alloalcanivorax gelatiniphagus]